MKKPMPRVYTVYDHEESRQWLIQNNLMPPWGSLQEESYERDFLIWFQSTSMGDEEDPRVWYFLYKGDCDRIGGIMKQTLDVYISEFSNDTDDNLVILETRSR